jgi:hypothetical protein
LLLVASFSVAWAAQPEEGVPSAEPKVEETTAQRDVALSIPQMREQAKKIMVEIHQGGKVIRLQLSQARGDRDVVKVLCLNDKLNQADVAADSANDRVTAFELAADSKDKDRADHEFTILQVLGDRVHSLVAEAQQCIGEETGFIGDSTVTFTIDREVADVEDPTDLPSDLPPIFYTTLSVPPPVSSPTL